MDRDTDALAERLFGAIAKGALNELREVYAPDAVIWHNTDGIEQSVDLHLSTLEMVTSSLDGLRYEEVQRQGTDSGFLQQHVLCAETSNGTELAIPCCLVATVKDGRITRIEEYLDPSPFAAAFAQ